MSEGNKNCSYLFSVLQIDFSFYYVEKVLANWLLTAATEVPCLLTYCFSIFICFLMYPSHCLIFTLCAL